MDNDVRTCVALDCRHLKEGALVLEEMRRSTSSTRLPQALLGDDRSPAAPPGESPRSRSLNNSNSYRANSRMGSTDHQHTPPKQTSSRMGSIHHQHTPLETQVNELAGKLAVLDEKIGRKMDGLEVALEKQGEMIKALLVVAQREP